MPFVLRFICLFSLSASFAAEKLSFNRDVRPILSENCFACHGFDSKHREAELRLDTAEGAYAEKDGAFPIKPGDLAKSQVWERIITEDEDDLMPPPKSHKKLTQAQKDILKLWIEQGATYQKHWAFEQPTLHTVGESVASPSKEVQTPIDAFLLQRQSRDKLALAESADKETLIRRVAFTLTGLPPTTKAVETFVDGQSYEAMVDSYLNSPRYGEEMARHWLDAARYADTHGLHLDNERSMWAYRDWVVKAFNENLPFDQFTTWQIAGDQLPNATTDQLIATGFSRCNVTTSEGGAIDEEYRHIYAVDRASTLTTVWMGLSGGCAQCHDHKFDPLTTAEFYSLYAFFFSSADPPMDGNISATQPFLNLPAAGEKQAMEEATQAESKALKALTASARKVGYKEPVAGKAEKTTQVIFDDVFEYGTETKNTTRNPSVWLHRPDFGAKSGQRVLKLANGQFSQEIITPSLTPVILGESPRISLWVRIDPLSPPRVLCLVINGRRVIWGDAVAFDATTYSRADAVTAGPLPVPGVWTLLSLDPTALLGLKSGTRLNDLSLQQIGGAVCWDQMEVTGAISANKDVCLSFMEWWKQTQASKKKPQEITGSLLKTLMTEPDKITDPKALDALRHFYLARIAQPMSPKIKTQRSAWQQARVALATAESAIPGSLIFRDAERPRDTFIAVRGAYNKLGDKVEPSTPAAFHPLKKTGARATRLDLAKWLVAPENPMTARVTVNRFWQQIFGIGLVKTSHDFGSQGEPPSHPELLDDMSLRFQKNGWDVKALVKQLVMSQAFRQLSSVDSNLLSLDPENRLLARGPRIRLDAEQIRDNALFVSGLINLELGGRGVRTYQPPNIWEPVGYGDSNTRYYLQDHGSALYRRSLYSFLKRTAPPPFMSNFDAPNREQSCTRRERSNTPMQALQLMNDVQHFEAARALAERVIAEGGKDDTAKMIWLFRTVLSRNPDAKESTMLNQALTKQRELYKAEPQAAEKAIRAGESTPKKIAPAIETASWTLIANLVLNLDETVTRN